MPEALHVVCPACHSLNRLPAARLDEKPACKLDTEQEQGIAARYGIRSIPTMILFRAGREAARQSGALNAQDIVRWVEANIR